MSTNPDMTRTSTFPAIPAEPNGQPDGDYQEPVYVDFGPGDDQYMPLTWAEKMLSRLFAEDPKRFAKLLTEVIIGAPNGQGKP